MTFLVDVMAFGCLLDAGGWCQGVQAAIDRLARPETPSTVIISAHAPSQLFYERIEAYQGISRLWFKDI